MVSAGAGYHQVAQDRSGAVTAEQLAPGLPASDRH